MESSLSQLPKPLIFMIINHLPADDAVSFALTSRQFNWVVTQDYVYWLHALEIDCRLSIDDELDKLQQSLGTDNPYKIYGLVRQKLMQYLADKIIATLEDPVYFKRLDAVEALTKYSHLVTNKPLLEEIPNDRSYALKLIFNLLLNNITIFSLVCHNMAVYELIENTLVTVAN